MSFAGGRKQPFPTVNVAMSRMNAYFVYDAFGKLAAEYTTNQTITTEGAKFLTADLVGSPRVATDKLGQVASRHDYMPFGEEIAATVGGRGQVTGFTVNDRIRQQFTGYERDGESGLDFAQNRYFAARLGRFTSVDPLAASASAKNPQTLNRYSYALNSPYKFTDPLGLEPCGLNGATSGSATGRTCNQSDDSPPPTVTIAELQRTSETYTVTGNVDEAIKSANTHFEGKYAGQADTNLSWSFSHTAKNGRSVYTDATWPNSNSQTVSVTGIASNITITPSATVSLPVWDGYDKASSEDQKKWDGFVNKLKEHEEGHVEIVVQEAERLKTDLEKVLPSDSKWEFKTSQPDAAIYQMVKSHFNESGVSDALTKGAQRNSDRQIDYDNKSNHRMTPSELREKKIVY